MPLSHPRPPQPRPTYAVRLHRLLRTSSHLFVRRPANPPRLKPTADNISALAIPVSPRAAALPPVPPSPPAITAALPPPAPPADHENISDPHIHDFFREPGTPALDTRTLSWESTGPLSTPDPPGPVVPAPPIEDRPREKRVSRRWSRELPPSSPVRRQRSSLGFLMAWRAEEYDDHPKSHPHPQPPPSPQRLQQRQKDDPAEHTPWQNAHVSRLNLRDLVVGGLDRRRSTSSDEDTKNTPWDTPSPAKTPVPLRDAAQHSPPLPESPPTPQSPQPPSSPSSPEGGDGKSAGSEDTVHFSSVSDSSLPLESEGIRPPVFKVQPVTGSVSLGKRVSTAGAPASAEQLIRQSSRRSSAWERICDGVPRPCRDKWSNAVIGATSRTVAPPNAKHVRTILDGLREGGSPSDRDTPVGAVLFALRTRIETPHWTVRLKTALFCHTVFRAGNQKFVDYIARAHADLFDPTSFVAGGAFAVCEQSTAHGSFAKAYAGYLRKWLAMKGAAKFPAGRTDASSARRFKSATSIDLLSSLPRLLDTLDCVTPLELYPGIEESPLGDAAISLVLRDSRTLLTALDAGVKRLVGLFFGLPDQSAVRAMAVYARYVRVVKDTRPVLGRMRGEGSAWMNSPDVSSGLVGRMQTYIQSGCKYKEPPVIKLSPVGESAKRKGEEVDAVRRESVILNDDVKQLESDDSIQLKGDEVTRLDTDLAEHLESDDAQPEESDEQLASEDLLPHGATPFPLRSRYPSDEEQ